MTSQNRELLFCYAIYTVNLGTGTISDLTISACVSSKRALSFRVTRSSAIRRQVRCCFWERFTNHMRSLDVKTCKQTSWKKCPLCEDRNKTILKKHNGCGLDSAGWDRDQWQSVVNVVINLWALQNAGNFINSRGSVYLSRSKLLCFMCCTNYLLLYQR
jgi:hypothetical protein